MDAMSTSLDSTRDLAAKLQAYLTIQRRTHVEIGALTRLSTGWESDVYAFETAQTLDSSSDPGAPPAMGARNGYILRLYFGSDAANKARDEGWAYALLAQAGYPVPRVYAVEPSSEALGRAFLILARVHGVSLGQLWRDPDPDVQARAFTRFCELFGALHTLAWQALPNADKIPTFTIEQQIGFWATILGSLQVEGLEAGVAWLQARVVTVTAQPLGLVHWDFHHENILVDGEDRAWVIDWTQFQVTDIRFDLAWTLVLLASERDAATAQRVRDGYFAVRGWREEDVAAELRFFEAAACLKRLVSVVVSLQRGADALGMRPGAETIMTQGLGRIANVYRQWLLLTNTPMPAVEELLAAHL